MKTRHHRSPLSTGEHHFLRRLRSRAVALAMVAAAAAALGACGNASPTDGAEGANPVEPGASFGSSEGQVGTVSLGLTVGGGAGISAVDYSVTGGSFHTSGTVDVSHSMTASVVVPDVPLGTGYVGTMTASSTSGPKLTCSGSSTFDVSSTGVTDVPVHVTCKEQVTTTPPPAAPVPVPLWAIWLLAFSMLGGALVLLQSPDAWASARRTPN